MNLTGDEVTTDEVEKIIIYASGAFITRRLNWSLNLPIRKSRALSGRPRRSSNFKLFFGGQFYPMLCALTKVFPVCFIVRARGIPFTLASVF